MRFRADICRSFLATAALSVSLLFLLSSCATTKLKKTNTKDEDSKPISPTPDGSAGAGTVQAFGFLKTDYPQLSAWLDKSFEVKYIAMTPDQIFQHPPLDQIYYETKFLPNDAKVFNFESAAISRREILKKISNFWDLDMQFVVGEDGQPTAIQVSGPVPEGATSGGY